MKEMMMGVFTYNGEDYEFNFQTSLSALDKMTFVKTVVHNLVDDEGYEIVVKDLIFDFAIIEMFTNIDTSFINAQDDDGNDINPIILVEHFLNETNVVDIVKSNMEADLLDELKHAVDLNIQYLTGIHCNPLSESVAKLISTLEKKVSETDLNGMMEMAQKFVGMTEDFSLENIVNAYMNSDMHQQNLAEIEASKDK